MEENQDASVMGYSFLDEARSVIVQREIERLPSRSFRRLMRPGSADVDRAARARVPTV